MKCMSDQWPRRAPDDGYVEANAPASRIALPLEEIRGELQEQRLGRVESRGQAHVDGVHGALPLVQERLQALRRCPVLDDVDQHGQSFGNRTASADGCVVRRCAQPHRQQVQAVHRSRTSPPARRVPQRPLEKRRLPNTMPQSERRLANSNCAPFGTDVRARPEVQHAIQDGRRAVLVGERRREVTDHDATRTDRCRTPPPPTTVPNNPPPANRALPRSSKCGAAGRRARDVFCGSSSRSPPRVGPLPPLRQSGAASPVGVDGSCNRPPPVGAV